MSTRNAELKAVLNEESHCANFPTSPPMLFPPLRSCSVLDRVPILAPRYRYYMGDAYGAMSQIMTHILLDCGNPPIDSGKTKKQRKLASSDEAM